MQIRLILWDWIGFNFFVYLKEPPLRSLVHPINSPLPPLETPHALFSSPLLFSLGCPTRPPLLGIPLLPHTKGCWVSICCWFLVFVVSKERVERQEKRRRRRSRKELKSWSRSRLRSDSAGWIFLEKKNLISKRLFQTDLK